jgi:5-methylcytosine-specific restriction enzyme subunit McrC
MQLITIEEEKESRIPKADIDENLLVSLHRHHRERIDIAFPTFLNDYSYVLRSKGCVGQIPISDDITLRISPKVPISNIFRMLEYAYNLRSFQFLEGITHVESLADLFENLVSILAKRVLDRVRKGLYRGYLREEDSLSFQRGKILIMPSLRAALRGSPRLECEYEEHTADLIDNRILIWTLSLLPRFGLKRDDVCQQVRQAYHALAGPVMVDRVEPRDCIRRFYNRLNDDYKPMHSLCRFFLEHCGPSLEIGECQFIPFILNMPNLFESFVTEWLKEHSPEGFYVTPQYQANLDEVGKFFFRIDLVLRDVITDRVLAVIDTKYKREQKPVEEDIKDIVAYAVRMRTESGILVYPSTDTQTIDLKVGDVKVRSVAFDISRDPDEGGYAFLEKLNVLLAS